MKTPRLKQQAGYALILVVLGLMGLGGIVITGFTQQARQDVEKQRYEHNQRVLQQAKQALLMFAYNYPNSNGGGPGRLPCPDVDNDGTVDGAGTCNQVGRFPFADARLNSHELLDASGERLWYALSDAFDNIAGGGIINSDTSGTITVLDQSGGILYDGDGAGIAAIIIAPGSIVRRDEDNDGDYEYTQIRGTAIQRNDPRNYLDTLSVQGAGANNELDNSVFTNGESDSNDDGFIQGPIYDPDASEFVINDQMIIITADEVIAMAEKAVLETYAQEIELYQQQFWAPAAYRFPWLSAYNNTTDLNWDNPAGTGVNMFDARPGETTGRVPFLDYHQDYDSHLVVTDLLIDFDITLTYTSMVDNLDPFDPTYIDEFSTLFTGFPAGVQTVDISKANLSFAKITFDGAFDITTDNLGTIISQTGATATVNAAPSLTRWRYFWDGCGGGCFEPADGWELCPVALGTGEDCARDAAGTAFVPYTDWANHADIAIRLIKMTLTVDPDFVVELDYDPAPIIAAPNAPTALVNARFSATYNATEITDYSAADMVETNLRNFIDLIVVCDQDNFVGDSLNLYELGNEDGGTILCPLNLISNTAANLNNQFVITADYYPQLPQWVAENNWDDALMMSYAPDFGPGGGGVCTPEDGDTGTGAPDDCLVITNMGGVNNDITSLLVLAGQHDFLDGDDLNDDGDYLDANEVAPDNLFFNELHDIFEPENYSNIGPDPAPNTDPDPPSDTELGLVFDKREDVVPGNATDTLFILDQL